MTQAAVKSIAPLARQTIPDALQLRWDAIRIRDRNIELRSSGGTSAFERVSIVASLEFISEERAIIEARVESRDRVERIICRRAASIKTVADPFDSSIRHFDCLLEHERLLAISYREDDGSLLYVNATFLPESGFAPGAIDAPTIQIFAASSDAATA